MPVARQSLLRLCAAVAFGIGGANSASAFEPTSSYVNQDVQGWTVRVHKSLLAEEKELGDRALSILSGRLFETAQLVPAKPLEQLRRVPIWLEFSNPKTSSAQYHPSREWLTENDFNPEKTKCVEIANADNFLKEQRRQPCMLIHELAHAYHERVLTFEEPRIMAAYERAKQAALYDKVLNFAAKDARHYALTNHKEFFAELTECYFGTNDFFPFVRPELQRHDPETFQLLEEIWAAP